MRRNYNPAARARLLAELAQRRLDGHTFAQIAATPGWPSRPTLRKWLAEVPEGAHGARELRRYGRRPARRFTFDPAAADELLRRVRWGEPIARLIREPHLPQRRALIAWQAANPDFAARLAAAKAFADPDRRHARRRRARPPTSSNRLGDEALQDRIVLALMRGATLPSLCRDRRFPSRLGLRRWRRADPEFDSVVAGACRIGQMARGRARAAARCTPAITRAIERHIVDGHSLASLAARPDMPGATTLYKWVRTNPAFAAAVAEACAFRDTWNLADRAEALAEIPTPAARAEAAALRQRLGQLNPHPGAKRPR